MPNIYTLVDKRVMLHVQAYYIVFMVGTFVTFHDYERHNFHCLTLWFTHHKWLSDNAKFEIQVTVIDLE